MCCLLGGCKEKQFSTSRGNTPCKSNLGFLRDMNELEKNLLKGLMAHLLGARAVRVTWRFSLGEKPVTAIGSLRKAKGEKVVPFARVALRKAENRLSNSACGNLGNQKEMQ